MHTGMCVQRDVTGMAPVCVRKRQLVCGCGLKQELGCPMLAWDVTGLSWGPSRMWGIALLHLSAPLLDPGQASAHMPASYKQLILDLLSFEHFLDEQHSAQCGRGFFAAGGH